eukprot:363740-Chlamydomonas_euryale.AAC.32
MVNTQALCALCVASEHFERVLTRMIRSRTVARQVQGLQARVLLRHGRHQLLGNAAEHALGNAAEHALLATRGAWRTVRAARGTLHGNAADTGYRHMIGDDSILQMGARRPRVRGAATSTCEEIKLLLAAARQLPSHTSSPRPNVKLAGEGGHINNMRKLAYKIFQTAL